MINRDIEQHMTIYYREPGALLYRKSPIQTIVPYKVTNRANKQNHISHIKFLHHQNYGGTIQEQEQEQKQEQKQNNIAPNISLLENINFGEDKRIWIGNKKY